jgi:hypothetical protein
MVLGNYILFLGGTRVRTQGFTLAKEALCCLNYTSNPWKLFFINKMFIILGTNICFLTSILVCCSEQVDFRGDDGLWMK